jgi:hypothetical protein
MLTEQAPKGLLNIEFGIISGNESIVHTWAVEEEEPVTQVEPQSLL